MIAIITKNCPRCGRLRKSHTPKQKEIWRKSRYLMAIKKQHHEGVTLREALTPLLDKWADEILGAE